MARKLAGEAKRLGVCDSRIGQVFAHSDEDKSDEAKPVIAIREMIEECESEKIENGFSIGLFNLRGTHWRGIHDGGEQERELAACYQRYADECRRWPRTSAVLRGMAESYLQDAAREDERAEARE